MIEVLADSERPRGITDLATNMGLTKSNVHRLLTALEGKGYVRRATSGYELTLKVWELGSRVISRLDLLRVARPYLAELGERTGESTHLAILDRNEVIYIDKIESPQPIRAYSRIGGRAPAHLVATGKALLAYARMAAEDINSGDEVGLCMGERNCILERGFSVNRGEWRTDVGGVAAPVFSGSGRLVAAIGMSGPIMRIPENSVDSIAASVVKAAAGASRALGYHGDKY